jgi:hypothetical protein
MYSELAHDFSNSSGLSTNGVIPPRPRLTLELHTTPSFTSIYISVIKPSGGFSIQLLTSIIAYLAAVTDLFLLIKYSNILQVDLKIIS